MQKNVSSRVAEPQSEWMSTDRIAQVNVTSEAPQYPIESALEGSDPGWRADRPGPQNIEITFNNPENIRRIRLVFEEKSAARTQEFVLAWSSGGDNWRDIARQQWNFSPNGSTRESEDYKLELPGVKGLRLSIRPDLNEASEAVASLREFRVS